MPSPPRRRFLGRLTVALAPGCVPGLARAAADAAPIAVASSLRLVWPALHEAAGAPALRASFGASRTLARQILQGAPFESLLSADATAIALLVDAGAADAGAVVDYAQGQLAWVAHADDAPAAIGTLAGWWRSSPTRRLAIAHPDHAPYGRAAVQVLQALSLWPLAPGQLLRGENAGQALQFFLAGAVDAALLPVSLVSHVAAAVDGRPVTAWRELSIAPAMHDPLVHRAVTLRGAGRDAHRLVEALRDEAVQRVLQSAGFAALPPD